MKTEVIEVRAKLQEKTDQLRASEHQNALLRNNIKHLEQQINSLKQQQFYNQQNTYQNRDWDDE